MLAARLVECYFATVLLCHSVTLPECYFRRRGGRSRNLGWAPGERETQRERVRERGSESESDGQGQ
eukprot:COSAG01_NODE_49830_length_368_cov_3.858736_1_plen_65_part_10